MDTANGYDEKYARATYYWGTKPSKMCDRVLDFIRPSPGFRPTLLDLGCGEGRNAVYFARLGFRVVGLDMSAQGLEKTQRLAEEHGVEVETVQADIVTWEPHDTYDVIFSTGTLQYLPPRIRAARLEQYKAATSPDGVHALSVFVDKPFIARAPDATDAEFLYRSGELLGYYWDWEIPYCTEAIFICTSGGVPHKHAMNRIIARRFRG